MENYGESKVITVLKGIAGALVGAIPGMLVWIILGKIGIVFSLVGMLIGFGILMGFSILTKNEDLPIWVMLVIFLGVFAVVMILSEQIVWTWEITDILKENLSEFSGSEYKEILKETIGIEKISFGECFSNFFTILEKLDIKGKYIWELAKSSLFGILGGLAVFAKIGK
ncbi:MAG: hypothetical protein K2J37_05095 [Ruminococcus sp.]|nr:hypothetical protein [Ruminococcus sp.]MDE6785305.1 hypothetical protein [Ruminococcus sp.]